MPLEEPSAQSYAAAGGAEGTALHGLTAAEVQAARARYGANEIPQERPRAMRVLLRKFWSPVPWMLEATIVLQLILSKADEAVIITVLLLVNALLSFVQERRANNALALL